MTKPIKKTGIKLSEKDKIAEHLDCINGRAQSFTARVADLIADANRAEERLAKVGLAKLSRVGARVDAVTSGPSKAYKYNALVTAYTLTRFRERWRLTAAERTSVRAGGGGYFRITVSGAMKEEIQRRAIEEFKIAA